MGLREFHLVDHDHQYKYIKESLTTITKRLRVASHASIVFCMSSIAYVYDSRDWHLKATFTTILEFKCLTCSKVTKI